MFPLDDWPVNADAACNALCVIRLNQRGGAKNRVRHEPRPCVGTPNLRQEGARLPSAHERVYSGRLRVFNPAKTNDGWDELPNGRSHELP